MKSIMGNVCRQDDRVEQPMNIGLGFAFDGLMNGNLLVMGDFTHKAWSDARFFNEFYEDQEVYSIGLQLTQGPMKWRLGYGYADDPLLDQVKSGVQISTIGLVNRWGETVTSPMYPLFMSYSLWKPSVIQTSYISWFRYRWVLAPANFDTHVVIQIEEEKCFGANQHCLQFYMILA